MYREPRVINIDPWDIEFALKDGSTNKFTLTFSGRPPNGETQYRIVLHLDIFWATVAGSKIVKAINELRARMNDLVCGAQERFNL